MTTVLFTFLTSLVLSLVLTPVAIRVGARLKIMDQPDERKVHRHSIPRTGGLAIFLAFFVSISLAKWYGTAVTDLLLLNRKILFFSLGAVVCFGVGFWDDLHRLGPKVKFPAQVLAASLAVAGGVSISRVGIFGVAVDFGVFSYAVTVFWIVLMINAVNLIDGLDGLAGGIIFFASIMMVVFGATGGQLGLAMLFAALAGATLGFLRYNFNPASVFLGDGGSYFLGYMIAGVAVMESVKGQLSAVLLIPLITLGVPVFDTILSPIRRFVTGKDMFRPDKGHVHHRLLKMGLTTRKAVLIIYVMTVALCGASILLVNLQDETAGLILVLLPLAAVFFTYKLGYLEYLALDKLLGWFRDLTDEAGFNRNRRTFLGIQMEMSRAADLDELWGYMTKAFNMLGCDMAELALRNGAGITGLEGGKTLRWSSNGFNCASDICKDGLLKLELPIKGRNNRLLGTLWLLKDINGGEVHYFLLRRIEQLRRTLSQVLDKFARPGSLWPEVGGQGSAVGGQESGVGGRGAEVGAQVSVVGGQLPAMIRRSEDQKVRR